MSTDDAVDSGEPDADRSTDAAPDGTGEGVSATGDGGQSNGRTSTDGASAGSDPGTAADEDPLVEVRNLTKHYPIEKGLLRREVGRVRAVDGISFDIGRGETLGLVGESGCGKSTAATSMLRLEEPTEGTVVVDGEDVTEYGRRELKRFRRTAQMIFQDPDSSFDPRMTVGESVAEPLRIHGMRDEERRQELVEELLELVGMNAEDHSRYPHEFSGGQKQRIALARALSVDPDLVVADEPASALDVSIQANILSLLDDLQEEYGLSVLFISHDLGVIRDICDRVAVMYLGEIVETGETEAIFSNPQHPYTRALLGSIPNPDPRERGRGTELRGDVPDPADPPSGCRFHTRCPEVIPPDDYDLAGEAWQSLMNLRVRVRQDELDPDTIREDAGTGDPAAAIREEFGIPATLSDGDADRVVSEAIDRVVAGDIAAADDLLESEFATVCERDAPDLQATDAGHPAACHLHDDSVATDPGPEPATEEATRNAGSD